MDKIQLNSRLENFLSTLENDDIKKAVAALNIPYDNSNISWATFVLTDDKPNANGKRIPTKEFERMISTGKYMPLKMEFGNRRGGHENSFPLGVIADLASEIYNDSNRIVGLAALWSKERPNDVDAIKHAVSTGERVDISWEVEYYGEDFEEDGTTALKDVNLTGATIVGWPAYGGRTPLMSIAQEGDESKLEENKLNEETLKAEIEQLKTKVEELTTKYNEALTMVSQKEVALAEATTKVTELEEFKAAAEKEEQDKAKLEAIKAKFIEAKVERDESFFEEKKDFLLGLEDTELDFMLQELAKAPEAHEETSSIPNVHSEPKDKGTKELVEFLKGKK